MFKGLSDKFQSLFSGLLKKGALTESNIADAVREVRLALLDADVNYQVVSHFIKKVKESHLGKEVIKGASAGDQFIKIIHDELVALMESGESKLFLHRNPSVIMLCGLQGCGKTTQAAKLALLLKGKHYVRRPLLVACDLQRPAAIDQLELLASQVGVCFFAERSAKTPQQVALAALKEAERLECDTLIVDTAGRLHVDQELMDELVAVKKALNPGDVLFVASAAMGQDAVETASAFDAAVGITGSILTMLDGSCRAGAVLSIAHVTQKPLLFEGIGEKVADLQPFNARSMADRILGMGDVVNLMRKAEGAFDQEETKQLEEKLLGGNFSYDDYLTQMKGMRKMGSFSSVLKMLPGLGGLGSLPMPAGEDADRRMGQMEAMILSMTRDERSGIVELTPSRRRRIAKGSGTAFDDVNKMIKQFHQFKELAQSFPSFEKKMKKNRGAISPQDILGKMGHGFGRFFQ